eukprot:350136-Chlamydomonas_euryale.AAC.2
MVCLLQGRPLSTVAAILMAMRAEIAQRAGRKPTAALEDALASFSDLQVWAWVAAATCVLVCAAP